MFRPAVINRMRAFNTRNLPHLVEVYDPERFESTGANFFILPNLIHTLPCRKAPSDIGATPNEHLLGTSDQSQVRWWVILAWDAPEMFPRYKFRVKGKDSDEGLEWSVDLDILAVMTKRTNRIMGKMLCLERQ